MVSQKKMLRFNPHKRCTVEEALSHPYLEELHRESDEPSATAPFNFEFERDYPDEIPKDVLQRKMYEEMLKYHPMEKTIYDTVRRTNKNAVNFKMGGGAEGK